MTPITKESFSKYNWSIVDGYYEHWFSFIDDKLCLIVNAQDGGWDNGWMYLPHIRTIETLVELWNMLCGTIDKWPELEKNVTTI